MSTGTSSEETNLKITWTIFASLNIILLAFFIALSALSRPDKDKAAKARQSISRTFADTKGFMEPPQVAPPQALQTLYQEIKTIAENNIDGFEVLESRQDGERIIISMPYNYFFLKENPAVFSGRKLISQVAQSLNQPEHTDFRIKALIEINSPDDNALANADMLFRQLANAGLTSSRITCGVKIAEHEKVSFILEAK